MTSLMDKVKEKIDEMFDRKSTTPHPFGKTTATIFAILNIVIGLIIFSYYTQSADCIAYDDWRRPFTTIATISVLIITIFSILIYIGKVMITYKKYGDNNVVSYNPLSLLIGLFMAGLFISLSSGLLYNTYSLSTKPEADYADGRLYEEHPKQRGIALATAVLLITGSSLPLMNYLGTEVINPPAPKIISF